MLAAIALEVVVLAGQPAKHVAYRLVDAKDEGFGHHHAARGIGGVLDQPADGGGVRWVHRREDRLGPGRVELVDHVDLIVAEERFDDARREGRIERLDQLGGGPGGRLLDQPGGDLGVDQAEEAAALRLAELQSEPEPVAGRKPAQDGLEGRSVRARQSLLERVLGRQLQLLGLGHGVAPRTGHRWSVGPSCRRCGGDASLDAAQPVGGRCRWAEPSGG